MSSNLNLTADQIHINLLSNRSHCWLSFEQMFRDESLTDVVINCGEEQIKAHKLVLSSWSTYFKQIFASNNDHFCHKSYVFLKDIPFDDLKILIELMYCGKASLKRHQLDSVERSAKALCINDLTQLLIPLDHNFNDINTNTQSIDYYHRKRKRKRDEDEENHDFSCDNSVDISDKQSDNENLDAETNSAEDQILKRTKVSNEVEDNQSDQDSHLGEESTDSPLDFKSNIQSIISKRKETKSIQKETNSAKTSEQIKLNGAQTNEINEKSIINMAGRKTHPVKIVELSPDSTQKDVKMTTQSKNKSSGELDIVFSRCLRSSAQQSSRFSQLSYEERQHHFKLQQMKYQNTIPTNSTPESGLTCDQNLPQTPHQTSTQTNQKTEKINSASDQTSDSEKLLIQLNPSDVLCDSEDSDCDHEVNKDKSSKQSATEMPVKQITIAKESQTKTNPNEKYPHSTPPALTTRLLINNGSVSAIKPNTSAEPLYVYNLVPNAMTFRSTSAAVSVPTTSAIMYISDPKVVQKRDSNTSSSEKKLVPNWTTLVRKTNIAPKVNVVKVTRNVSPASNTLLSNPGVSQMRKKMLSNKEGNEKMVQSNEKIAQSNEKIAQTNEKIVQTSINKSKNIKKRNSYQCSRCTKAYSSNQTLIDHVKIVHENSTENYACKICGKAVKWKDSLRSHFKTNHPDVDSTNMIEVLS